MQPIVLLFMLVALVAWSRTAAAFDDTALATLLEQARTEMKAPGVRAAVLYSDGRLVRSAVGVANKKTGSPLDDDIGMPGGSTGKTFVAALTMLLVEDGALALDDPVSKYLGNEPWFRRMPGRDKVQVHHLLSHTSGVNDYPGSVRFNLSMAARVIRHGSAKYQPEELIGYGLKRKTHFPTGEGYRYSDVGYLILGRVIEAATGKTYYQLLSDRILDPLQLDAIRLQNESVLTDVAMGYMAGQPSIKKDGRMKLDPSSEWTGGGLITNPTMLVRFHDALAAGNVVNAASFRLMLESGWRDPGHPEWHYGYGMFVHGSSYSHGGLWPGFRSHVLHDLDSGTTVAVQANRDGRIDLRGLAWRIAARATGLTAPD